MESISIDCFALEDQKKCPAWPWFGLSRPSSYHARSNDAHTGSFCTFGNHNTFVRAAYESEKEHTHILAPIHISSRVPCRERSRREIKIHLGKPSVYCSVWTIRILLWDRPTCCCQPPETRFVVLYSDLHCYIVGDRSLNVLVELNLSPYMGECRVQRKAALSNA